MIYIIAKANVFVQRLPNGNFAFSYSCFQPADTLTAEERKKFGVFALTSTQAPSCDARKQYVEEADPVLTKKSWCQAWRVVDMADDQIKADKERRSALVRAARDSRLLACDWTRLDDVVLVDKKKWAIYRQALRDVPQQAEFPYEIIWPEVP